MFQSTWNLSSMHKTWRCAPSRIFSTTRLISKPVKIGTISSISIRISKLEMLRETPVALGIANKLLQNLLKIQPVVKSVEFALLESHAHSQLTSLQEGIDKLNKQTQKMLVKADGSYGSEKGFLFSSIVKRNVHKRILKSWFGHAGSTPIYRATRDGWDLSQFNAKCSQAGPTVQRKMQSGWSYSCAEKDDSGCIFGGFCCSWATPDNQPYLGKAAIFM
ncbi:hypothetical protein SARC_08383 [Sphaeroforma arctica JP610]|uniref:TLDc domain-containing protein n=1 Tax=Sphaeroforma arctica JP610 TaxID=667725 RepID=A0A0L0FRA2_9EUKA|nr:hypothetical protein SARC_08383 [Sphaeroforma arctica JP610]KNC79214.1 hypothetical protein SARC_08383 [Sphaeroforma arctica JP610]|eukprot:XP_014153116.1 hypothetical protein SARC_08383 [Sphaeroforma arctica JP610]